MRPSGAHTHPSGGTGALAVLAAAVAVIAAVKILLAVLWLLAAILGLAVALAVALAAWLNRREPGPPWTGRRQLPRAVPAQPLRPVSAPPRRAIEPGQHLHLHIHGILSGEQAQQATEIITTHREDRNAGH